MSNQTTTAAAPGQPSKASAAPPQLNTDENVELNSIHGKEEEKLPLHEDVMQLARLGEITAIQKLFDEGKFTAQHKDAEGITPLHWAAINNHYATCKFLIESGADVNAKGGEAVATPAMWAAQRCNYYIVHLLLNHGANPLLTDAQGYNILHLATFDGNVYLLVLLLHQDIPIDTPDLQGHTSLMWAAYKGFPAVLDLFLRWGASVSARDENGFMALHWALVKGSQPCIQKLIEYGADRFAETATQKTPAIVADEMQSARIWRRSLADCGFKEDGNPKPLPLPYGSLVKSPNFFNRFYFFLPFLTIFVVIFILSKLVVFVGVPIALLFAYFFQWYALKLLEWAPPDMRSIHKTPYLAGVFAGTLFWVGVRWAAAILPNTFSSSFVLNLLFLVSYALCAYFYAIAMVEDPGYVPKTGSRNNQKAVIDELMGLWKFDDQNFCIQCMIRRPLRSKHCKRCKRCVAKHDHHCPWINNCVGANNHRHFFLYILSMATGIGFLVRLVFIHLQTLPPPSKSQCNILAESLCKFILKDTFTVILTVWTTLQLTWVSMLLFVQLVQICKAQTTYENMLGHVHGSQASEAITSALTSGTTSMNGAQLGSSGMGPNPAIRAGHQHGHSHAHGEGCWAQWKKILGLDTFVATAQEGLEGGNQSRRPRNPFSRGVVTNCKDFWCDPAPYFGQRETGAAMLGGDVVNYARMYEPPPRMKMRRPQCKAFYQQQSVGVNIVSDVVKMEEDPRVKAFRKLKPVCVALSQAALEYKGRKAPGTEVVKSVNNLLQVLGPVSKTSNALDGKLADYVFFPLSHLFQESDSLPPGAIKISLQCLQILISQGWRLSLSPGLFKQLLMLLSFLPRGSAANAKGRDVDEDLSAAALDCLTSLFDVSKDPLSDDTRCIKSENIPILGHLITVILEALSDGPSPKVQNAALNSLKAVISSIHDQQALASFLPGIVSSTTKVLQPKTQGRRSYRTLQGCLDVLAKIIRETIGDDKIREIRQRAQVSTKTAKPDEPGITEAWVKATSSQLKLALANVVRLQYHETSDVQNSLFELCLSILQNCRESLSGSAAMMIEALLVICAQDFSSSERAKLQALNNLATTDRGLLDLLKALLHDRIVSLPRLMQSNDDISKSRSMAQIVSTLQVLSGQRMDYKIMEEPLAEGLRGSAVAAIHASSSKASDLISDQSLQVISASSSKSESIRFGPVLAGSTSQKVAAKGINRILMQLHATSSLPVLKRKFVDDIRTTTGDTQLASFWLSFTILEHASSHAMDVDQLLNLPPRMKSGDDGFQDAIYSFAIDTLSTSIVEDENDWRLQAISLETVALQARQDKLDFRPELVDALYPVVERIGSENSLLRDHAMTCLNILSHECGYSSPSDLIFQNVDYLVNTIALKFNTFDISPQGPQVLVMMIKLCGAPLLPYLDDIVESMFSALANFHSYSSLVESLFSVFTAIIEETNKTVPPISPSPHLKQPYHSTTIAELAYTLKNLDKPTDPLHPSFSAPDLGPSSDLPSDSLTAKSRTDSLTSDPQAQSPPFTALLPRIVTLTQHYLTHPSSPLRLSLCGLLTTAFEPLSRDEDTFLPLIHALWPVIIPRLYDRESFVAIAAANTIGATCRFAGDFMSLRIQDEWAQWEKLFLKLDTQVQSERKRRRGRRDIHSTTEKMWEAMVSMTLEVVMHVRVTKEMEDSIIEILTPELLAGRQDVRSVLEGLNADAVWLVEEMERLRRGGKPLQRPEGFEEWEFKEVTL